MSRASEEPGHHERISDALSRLIEVTEKAKRRSFTVEYKRRIVKQADACKVLGDMGVLLRREGLSSSQLAAWRAARNRGDFVPKAAAKKRRSESIAMDPRDKRLVERELIRQTKRAERLAAIAEIQEKVAALLGRPFSSEES